jgi:hypothetical protein
VLGEAGSTAGRGKRRQAEFAAGHLSFCYRNLLEGLHTALQVLHHLAPQMRLPDAARPALH